MSKAKEYYDFKAKVIEERELSFNLEVITPDKYKGLKCWSAKSLIENYQVVDNIITGKIITWCFASKVKEQEKKEESKTEKTEGKIGAPSIVNINFDTSKLISMVLGLGDQISGVANSVIEMKESLIELIELLAKPKTEPTLANK